MPGAKYAQHAQIRFKNPFPVKQSFYSSKKIFPFEKLTERENSEKKFERDHLGFSVSFRLATIRRNMPIERHRRSDIFPAEVGAAATGTGNVVIGGAEDGRTWPFGQVSYRFLVKSNSRMMR